MTEQRQFVVPQVGVQPPLPAPYPPSVPPLAPLPRPSRVKQMLAGLTLAALLGLAVYQAWQIAELSGQLAAVRQQSEAGRAADNAAAQAVSSRVAALEKAAFHPDLIAEAALPSVFRVKAEGSSGSAWAVGNPAADGGTNLFTNFHVVQAVWDKGGRKVTIEHKDQLYDAQIVKVDKDTDVAQLTTTARFTGLKISAETVRPGEPIVVVGAPLGLESSVTTGVVSAFRKIEGTDETYVQFDAPINPGNSGGPVINARGEVVGMATAKLRNSEGIGLAIPISLVCQAVPICG